LTTRLGAFSLRLKSFRDPTKSSTPLLCSAELTVVPCCGEGVFRAGALVDRPFTITGVVDIDGVVELIVASLDGVAIRRLVGDAESFETEAATLAKEGLGISGDTWVGAMMDFDKGFRASTLPQAVGIFMVLETE
jgi:hypothetical protein